MADSLQYRAYYTLQVLYLSDIDSDFEVLRKTARGGATASSDLKPEKTANQPNQQHHPLSIPGMVF